MRRALKDLEKQGQPTLRAILSMSEDARALDMRQLRFADLDTYGNMHAIGGPGTLAREASKLVDANYRGGRFRHDAGQLDAPVELVYARGQRPPVYVGQPAEHGAVFQDEA